MQFEDAVIRADHGKLVIKRSQLLLLRLIGIRFQVHLDLALSRTDQIAERLKPVWVADEGRLRQKASEQIHLRLCFQQAA